MKQFLYRNAFAYPAYSQGGQVINMTQSDENEHTKSMLEKYKVEVMEDMARGKSNRNQKGSRRRS
jgi:hypothetical protein